MACAVIVSYERDAEKLSVSRDRKFLAAMVTRKEEAFRDSQDAYFAWFNHLYGCDIDPAKLREQQFREQKARYEKIVGCALDSDEFKRRIDATVEALTNPYQEPEHAA